MEYLSFLKKRWYLVLLILILLGVFFWRKTNTMANAAKTKKGIYVVKRGDLKEELVLSGAIKADQDVVVRFKTSGRLAWVGVKEGDRVRKHQIIARLDTGELRRNLRKKLNLFMKGRYDFDQTKDDYKDKVISDEVKRILDKSQLTLDNDIIDVELQNLSLKYARLYTPIEGIVTKVESPYAGVNITPAQAEFEIVNPKTLYLSLSTDQTEVIGLRKGEKGRISFDAYPEKEIIGEIGYISFAPKTDETGTVYEVKVKFLDNIGEQANNDYRLGMTGDFKITLREKKNVLSVPLAYIKQQGKDKIVYVLQNNKRIKKVVEVGMEADGQAEILKGLHEGERIIF